MSRQAIRESKALAAKAAAEDQKEADDFQKAVRASEADAAAAKARVDLKEVDDVQEAIRATAATAKAAEARPSKAAARKARPSKAEAEAAAEAAAQLREGLRQAVRESKEAAKATALAEQVFDRVLAKKGFKRTKKLPDGDCFYHCLAGHLALDGGRAYSASRLRNAVADEMQANRADYLLSWDEEVEKESLDDHIMKMRVPKNVWADNIEIRAAQNAFKIRRVHIHQPDGFVHDFVLGHTPAAAAAAHISETTPFHLAYLLRNHYDLLTPSVDEAWRVSQSAEAAEAAAAEAALPLVGECSGGAGDGGGGLGDGGSGLGGDGGGLSGGGGDGGELGGGGDGLEPMPPPREHRLDEAALPLVASLAPRWHWLEKEQHWIKKVQQKEKEIAEQLAVGQQLQQAMALHGWNRRDVDGEGMPMHARMSA